MTGDFSFVQNGVRDSKPRAGEPAIYAVTKDSFSGKPLEDDGLIWMSTSSSGARLLMPAGRTSAGTGGVGEFFGNFQKMR